MIDILNVFQRVANIFWWSLTSIFTSLWQHCNNVPSILEVGSLHIITTAAMLQGNLSVNDIEELQLFDRISDTILNKLKSKLQNWKYRPWVGLRQNVLYFDPRKFRNRLLKEVLFVTSYWGGSGIGSPVSTQRCFNVQRYMDVMDVN